MALIVEDGTGVANANSYDTVANAQAYFDLLGITLTITDESLIQATMYLDLTYWRSYAGDKLTGDQSLAYPRSAFTDLDGFERDASTIHIELKRALYESAKLKLDDVDLFDNTSVEGDNLKSATSTLEGAVSESQTWFSPQRTDTRVGIGKYLTNILKAGANRIVRVK